MTSRILTGTVLIAIAAGGQAMADPPERVARVSFLGGVSSMRTGGAPDWAPTVMNYPLTIGDDVWTDRAGRVELTMGATAVDLDAMTATSILNLDHHVVQLRVAQGAVIARVRELAPDESLEIDMPNGVVTLLRPGVYRIDVAPTGDSATVTVRSGDAEVTAGPAALPLHAGQTVSVVGLEQPSPRLASTLPPDEFDDWAIMRDRRVDAAAAVRYVPRAMVGYEDLDEFGTWNVVAEYGSVWVPHVRPGWAPYHYGHWAWVNPWGWTWIDDAPWGFAPFHYGRWAYVSSGWVWVPGTIVARPVYSPALVAFVGGAGWHVGVTVGAVGWFPLAPREVFVPAYAVSPAYVVAMNRPHVAVTTVNVNVTTVTYVNRAVPGAMMAVSRETFTQARPVAAAAVAVTPQALGAAVVVGHAAPREFAPVAGARVVGVAPPAVVAARAVVVRTPPPAEIRPSVVRRTVMSVPAAPPPRSIPAPAVPPPVPAPPPAAVSRVSPDRASAEMAARHAQERVDAEARHATERAEMQARHNAEAARAAKDQAQAQAQRAKQAREQAELDARQKREHDQLQKKQETERKKP